MNKEKLIKEWAELGYNEDSTGDYNYTKLTMIKKYGVSHYGGTYNLIICFYENDVTAFGDACDEICANLSYEEITLIQKTMEWLNNEY